jgi:hypothetical protein
MAVPEVYRKQWNGRAQPLLERHLHRGELNGADFGNDAIGFISAGELVGSFGMIVDVSALFKFSF